MAGSKARVPPRWFVATAWQAGWIVRASGRRMELWPPRPNKWGFHATHDPRPAQG